MIPLFIILDFLNVMVILLKNFCVYWPIGSICKVRSAPDDEYIYFMGSPSHPPVKNICIQLVIVLIEGFYNYSFQIHI